MSYFLMKWLLVVPILRVLFRIEVIGRENVPRAGRVILAANHLNFFDSPLIAAMVTRPVSFGAMSELFDGKGIIGWIRRRFFLASKQIPVDRQHPRRAQEGFIGEAIIRLNDGYIVGIHPEGMSSPDGRLYRARGGVAVLAFNTKAPIVPIGVIGTQRGGRRTWTRRVRVRISFGLPITYTEYDGLSRYELARLVIDRIAPLSNQQRADTYAPIGEKK